MQRSPFVTPFDMGSLHREPRGAMGGFLLAPIASMRNKSVVERLAINVLRVRRQCLRTDGGSSSLLRYGMPQSHQIARSNPSGHCRPDVGLCY